VQTFIYSAAADFAFVCVIVAYLLIRKDSNFRDPKPLEPKKRKT
jgi:hypothetical protein